MRFYFLFFIFSFLIISCESNSDGIIVQYGDSVLTKTDLIKIIPNDLAKEDSTDFVNQYIEEWVKNKVFLQNSQKILSEEELSNIELKVSNYRNDITTSFLEEKLTEGLNDSISDKEIENYYNQYAESFDIKEDYLSYRYMIIPTDSVTNYKSLLKDEKYEELKKKLEKFNYSYDLKENNWISKKDFENTDVFPDEIKRINLNIKNQIYTITNEPNSFIFELVDYVKSGQTSPLPLVKDVIKNVLINKRKLNLLSEKKKELYNKALENNEIKRN